MVPASIVTSVSSPPLKQEDLSWPHILLCYALHRITVLLFTGNHKSCLYLYTTIVCLFPFSLLGFQLSQCSIFSPHLTWSDNNVFDVVNHFHPWNTSSFGFQDNTLSCFLPNFPVPFSQSPLLPLPPLLVSHCWNSLEFRAWSFFFSILFFSF